MVLIKTLHVLCALSMSTHIIHDFTKSAKCIKSNRSDVLYILVSYGATYSATCVLPPILMYKTIESMAKLMISHNKSWRLKWEGGILGYYTYLDIWHNKGGTAVSFKRRPHFTPKLIPWYSLLLETGWAPGLLNNGQKQEITWNFPRTLPRIEIARPSVNMGAG